MIEKEIHCLNFVFFLHMGYFLILMSYSIAGENGENIRQNSEMFDKESVTHFDGENNAGMFSRFLSLPYKILGLSDEAILFLAKKLIPLEARELFKEVYGHLNPTFFFAFNVALCSALIYVLFKFPVVGVEDEMFKKFKDALLSTSSEITYVEKETSSLMQELSDVEEKINKRKREEEGMQLEENEIKNKMDEVMKERDEMRKESKKLESKVSEDVVKLKELRMQRGVICKQNESLRSEISQLQQNERAMEDEVKKKQREVEGCLSRESKLMERLQKASIQLSTFKHEKEEASDKLQKLHERSHNLKSNHHHLQEGDSQVSIVLDKYGHENDLLQQCLNSWLALEREIQIQSDDDDPDVKKEMIKGLFEISEVEMKLKLTEDELESLHDAVAVEQNEEKLLEDETKKTKQEYDQILESHKNSEKSSQAASVKLEVLSNHFKDREKELVIKLGELEEKDYQALDGCKLNEERTNQLMQLAHHYKIEMDVLQREIQMAESNYKEKIMMLEKKAHDSWLACRQTERDAKNAQQEVDNLKAQLLDAKESLDRAEKKHNELMAKRMPLPYPRPLIPFPRPPMMHLPPRHPFLPIFRPQEQDSISSRSTPLSHAERHHTAPTTVPEQKVRVSNESAIRDSQPPPCRTK